MLTIFFQHFLVTKIAVKAQLFIANYESKHQWEASTLVNSQKSMAENVVGFVDIKKIGED